MFSWLFSLIKGYAQNFHAWFDKAMHEFGRDVYSLRAAWAHIYLALYVFLAIWGTFHIRTSFNVIITVTGGVVSAIFTSYVLSTKRGDKNDTDKGNGDNT